ncbi:uncharacterized protein PG986_013964 [Apiospora aurea]|uniref:DUF6594 domain-containing protein n=1 Tax=Apiospora aurea TaxID=335848 RepID=A0ABR1PX22_9PEZI
MRTPRHKSSSTLVSSSSSPLDETVRRRLGSLLATSRRYTAAANGWEATSSSKPRRIKSVDWRPSSKGRGQAATSTTTTTTTNTTKGLNAKNVSGGGGGKVCVLNAIIMGSSDFSSAREEAYAWDRRLDLALPMPLESNNAKAPGKARKSVSDLSSATDESSDSSGSNSTVTQASFARRDSPTIPAPNERPQKAPAPRPDALRFLVEDTDARPELGPLEDDPPRGRRSTVSSVGSAASSTRSIKSAASGAVGDDNDTDHHTSPELSPKTPKGRHLAVDLGNSNCNGSSKTRRQQRSYGTPEMPRGNANLPHVSPSLLTPRASNFGQHVKHLPRAEKLPLSGYELLASRLSTAGAPSAEMPAEPQLKPIYRRFEPLNHRLLLHLQDELCELEEQLHRLDTADTQNRRLQNGILPASRRADSQTAGELQWHKTDILGKIGFKLEQYNHVLASFQTTRTMPKPALADVREYQGYLAANVPIAEHETRFLDAADDLVCLADEPAEPLRDGGYLRGGEEGQLQQQFATDHQRSPRRRSIQYSPVSRWSLREDTPDESSYGEGGDVGEDGEAPVISLSLAMAVAVIAPIMAFGIVPGYFGRLIVVLLVSVAVLWGLVHERVVGVHATRDFYICAGLYGMAMAVVAGIYR